MKKGTGVELDPADALRRAATHKPPVSSTSHKSIPAIPANRGGLTTSAVEGRTDMPFKVAAQKVKLVVGGPAFGSRASSSLRRL